MKTVQCYVSCPLRDAKGGVTKNFVARSAREIVGLPHLQNRCAAPVSEE